MQFPKDTLPYLGLWVTAGGYRGEYNCAFEPASAFYDDIAIARQNGTLPMLSAGENLQFSLSIALEALH